MPPAATILHADLDAFYASVEQMLDRSLRGRPIAVGAGVVLAASYEARVFGVRGGMSGYAARRLCPALQFVPGHFGKYQELADRVFDVCRAYTPMIERISIDEAFLEVAGSVHLFGSPVDMAVAIRARVREEIGLPLSIGIARTKHLAKVASQVAKPDGLIAVDPDAEAEFLAPLPVGLVWGVGPVTEERLKGRGITTIGDLAVASPRHLAGLLGPAAGNKLASLARNLDPRSIEVTHRARSVSAQSAFGSKPVAPDLISRTLVHLADRVTSRLRAKGRAGRTIIARVRFADLRSVTRSLTLPVPVSSTSTVAKGAHALVADALRDHPGERRISLLGVALSGLVPEPAFQLELPLELEPGYLRPGTNPAASRWAVERAMDEVRRRFGRGAIGYASVRLGGGGVPDGFRELAEREV